MHKVLRDDIYANIIDPDRKYPNGMAISGPTTKQEAEKALADAIKRHLLPEGSMHGLYRDRATGRWLERMWATDAVAHEVSARRESERKRGKRWDWDAAQVWEKKFRTPAQMDGGEAFEGEVLADLDIAKCCFCEQAGMEDVMPCSGPGCAYCAHQDCIPLRRWMCNGEGEWRCIECEAIARPLERRITKKRRAGSAMLLHKT